MLRADDRARIDQLLQYVFGDFVKEPPGSRERRRIAAAVDELCANPLLERTYSATEARLGDVPGLRGSREALAVCQGDEVLEPLHFHLLFHRR